jgi:two-component system, sensor histidine kinase YesM
MRLAHTIIVLFISMFIAPQLWAQDSIKKKQKVYDQKSIEVKEAGNALQNSLKKNNNFEIAPDYERLAIGFEARADYPHAEEYYKKALEVYTTLKDKSAMARLSRSIAKVQEQQNKLGAAALNYKAAEKISPDSKFERLNSNDYNRLTQGADNSMRYAESNIKLLEKDKKTEEASEAYVKKAEIDLKSNNTGEAIKSYNKAIKYTDEPAKMVEINNSLSKVLVATSRYDEAIAATQRLLDSARVHNDLNAQMGHLQTLSDIYFEKGTPQQAIPVLEEAHSIAVKTGKTAAAKKSLEDLVTYYKSVGDTKSITPLYESFFNEFDTLIHNDSSLVDAKTFQVTEQKIKQLEQEKVLKDELISRKNVFNYFLLGSVLLLLFFVGAIVKAFYSIKNKNREIALQSLRREMNPHFIFNSLNSVNHFISQNNELEANKYLTSYSYLMRNVMENSNRDFILLGNEIEQLNKYLQLEHMRFANKFDYTITIDEGLDTDALYVPNMIIQPHLENAIWHGLRYKDEKGYLNVTFRQVNGSVTVTIEDDGIGLAKSSELKTDNQKVHKSRGITNTRERIGLLGELYKKEITFSIAEKALPETGTVVQIIFPLIYSI